MTRQGQRRARPAAPASPPAPGPARPRPPGERRGSGEGGGDGPGRLRPREAAHGNAEPRPEKPVVGSAAGGPFPSSPSVPSLPSHLLFPFLPSFPSLLSFLFLSFPFFPPGCHRSGQPAGPRRPGRAVQGGCSSGGWRGEIKGKGEKGREKRERKKKRRKKGKGKELRATPPGREPGGEAQAKSPLLLLRRERGARAGAAPGWSRGAPPAAPSPAAPCPAPPGGRGLEPGRNEAAQLAPRGESCLALPPAFRPPPAADAFVPFQTTTRKLLRNKSAPLF